MTTEQYTARRWVCRRRYAWNTEKVMKSWMAKQFTISHPQINHSLMIPTEYNKLHMSQTSHDVPIHGLCPIQ
jgi:hypothetical protein